MSPLSFPHLSPTVVCNSFHTARCRCIEQQGGKFSVYLKCKTSMVLHVERLTRNIDISWLYQQATWFQLPWQLNNVIFWDPSKNQYHHSPHWQHSATGVHLPPHNSHVNQPRCTQVRFTGCSQHLMPAAQQLSGLFCPSLSSTTAYNGSSQLVPVSTVCSVLLP